MKQLRPKQRLFIKEYLIDLNATQAAIRAGYSAKTSYSHGQRLLKDVEIQNALTSAMHKREDNIEITAARVLKELAIIAYADQSDYVTIGTEGEVKLIPFDTMKEGASRAVSGVEETRRIMGSGTGKGTEMILEIKTKYRHHDKVKALELLGNHLGMWKDRQEVTFPDVETFELPKLAAAVTTKGNGGNGGNGGHTD